MTSQPSDPAPDASQPDARPAARDVEYKGGPLDPEKGPGLGCFWLQVVVLAIAIVLTPLAAAWEWPIPVIIVLLAITIVLLLFVGQTIIFLLRLVAADRRAEARRRPLRSRTKTVGELEDEAREQPGAEAGSADGPASDPSDPSDPSETDGEGVRE